MKKIQKIINISFVLLLLIIQFINANENASATPDDRHQSHSAKALGTGTSSVVAVSSPSGSGAAIKRLVQKPTVTRAELKVSRSLDPENTQTLNVRTNRGDIATLIVKKRDHKSTSDQRFGPPPNGADLKRAIYGPVTVLEPIQQQQTQSQPQQQQQLSAVPKSISHVSGNSNGGGGGSWSVLPSINQNYQYDNSNSNRQIYAAPQYRFATSYEASDKNSMDVINSFLKHVENIEKKPRQYLAESSIANDRRPVHIPVSSTKVNDQMQQSQSQPQQQVKVPPPVFISSDAVYVKDNNANGGKQAAKRGRSLMEIGADGIPLIHGIRVPDDENDKKHTWRNARVINGELVPYEKGYVPQPAESIQTDYGQLVFAKKNTDQSSRSIGPFTTADNFSPVEQPKSIGPFSVEDNLNPVFGSPSNGDANAHNKRLSKYDDIKRYLPGHSGIGPFSVADNSRTSNAKLIEYIKKINDRESRRDYFAGRASKVVFSEQPKIQRRMLQNPGNPIYPTSALYSPASAASDSNLNSNFVENGVRSPVLQYAHPEFGVQPAKSMPAPSEQEKSPFGKVKSTKIEYYSKNIHSDRSPYAIEPAMGSKDFYENGNGNNKYGQYHHQDDMYKPFKNPATYPYNYGFIRRVKAERPYWMQLTEQMRDSFQNGFATVQEMTRPVIDPIVEAGQKISQNLGFSSGQPGASSNSGNAQEKVGLVVAPASGSIILPALGLVAGGAALGLGAVAVGRLFDVAQIKRSDQKNLLDLEMEHKRALSAIHGNNQQQHSMSTGEQSASANGNLYFVMEEPSGAAQQNRRYRRSINYYAFDGASGKDGNAMRYKRDTANNYGDANRDIYRNDKFDEQQSDVIEIYDIENNENSAAQDDLAEDAKFFNDYFRVIAVPEEQDNALLSEETLSVRPAGHRISKRSIGIATDDSLGSILQDVEQDIPKSSKIGFEQRIKNTDWSNTPCAKKVFCEVMLQQNSDDVVLMEKKMYTLLGMMHPALGATLTQHLAEVTEAIRRHDCSPFICYQL